MTGSDVLPVIFVFRNGIRKKDSALTPPEGETSQVLQLLRSELKLNPTALVPLRHGTWSTAFGFQSDGQALVIRISEHREDFARDEFAARFSEPNLQIPSIMHRGTFEGRHYAISERVLGKFLDDLASDGMHRVLPSLLQTLNALRLADTSSTSGYGSWDEYGNGVAGTWRDHLIASIEDNPDNRGGPWRRTLETSPTGASAFDRDAAVLVQRVGDMPDARHLIHGDLLNFNVFVAQDRISGVIDWGCAMHGDFLYDLAWLAFWWPWYPHWNDVDIVEEARRHFSIAGADLESFRERILVYQLQIGLTHQAYHATTGNWAMLEAVTRRTTAIADEIR